MTYRSPNPTLDALAVATVRQPIEAPIRLVIVDDHPVMRAGLAPPSAPSDQAKNPAWGACTAASPPPAKAASKPWAAGALLSREALARKLAW